MSDKVTEQYNNFSKLASVLLSYTLDDLKKAKLEDELMEVISNAEEEISDS